MFMHSSSSSSYPSVALEFGVWHCGCKYCYFLHFSLKTHRQHNEFFADFFLSLCLSSIRREKNTFLLWTWKLYGQVRKTKQRKTLLDAAYWIQIWITFWWGTATWKRVKKAKLTMRDWNWVSTWTFHVHTNVLISLCCCVAFLSFRHRNWSIFAVLINLFTHLFHEKKLPELQSCHGWNSVLCWKPKIITKASEKNKSNRDC